MDEHSAPQTDVLDDALYALEMAPAQRRAVRERAGVSRKILARQLGCSVQAVYTWERPRDSGGRSPQADRAIEYGRTLRRLAARQIESSDDRTE